MKYLFLFTLVLLNGLTSFAQESTITKAEFDEVMAGSYKAIGRQPYRTIEEYENQGPFGESKTKIITERFGPNSYTIYEFDSTSTYSKIETILINGKKFVRKLNGVWQEEPLTRGAPPPPDWETVTDETIYKSLGERTIEAKKVKVFQSTQTRATVNKISGFQVSQTMITTFYIDESGLMFRSRSSAETINKAKDKEGAAQVSKPFRSFTKQIKTVEIDPAIVIAAPPAG